MNYDHKHQLAFLLSLAALPIGGCVISDGDDDDDNGDDSTGSVSNTDPTVADDDDDSGSMTMTMTADDTGTESVDDSGSSSGGTADDTAGTTGGETPQVCLDVGAHYEKCAFKDAATVVEECVYYVTNPAYTAECATANEEYYACLAMTACEDFGKENPCQAALDAAGEVCAGSGTESGTDSGSSTGG